MDTDRHPFKSGIQSYLEKEMLAKVGSRNASMGEGHLENPGNKSILKHPFSKDLRICLGTSSGS